MNAIASSSHTHVSSLSQKKPTQTHPFRIIVTAGEASGDILGAELLTALRQHLPNATYAGIAGPAMRNAGCSPWFTTEELSLMGMFEVLRHLPRILRLRKQFLQRLLECKPDVYIGIDAPDFNFGIERILKKHGILTVHYVSPSIWAWKPRRAANMHQMIDRLLCLFPMEPALYASYPLKAQYVGHPTADRIPLENDKQAARKQLGLPINTPLLAILPGSRLGEIKRLNRCFLSAALRVQKTITNLCICIPAANAACHAQIAAEIPTELQNIHIIDGNARTVMAAADVVLLASGTATLEATLIKRPMVVGYKVHPMTYAIVRTLRLVHIDRFALPNILSQKSLVPEFIQDQCTDENLARALLHWFTTPQAVAELLPHFQRIHENLRHNASDKAARIIADLLLPLHFHN